MIKDRNIAPDAAIQPSKILGGGALGAGQIFYAAVSGDEQHSFWASRVHPDRLFTDIPNAVAAMQSNRHDILVLSAQSTFSLSEMLSITKNRIHLVGSDMRAGFGMGARTKISLTATSGATNIGTIQNTGIGNTFTGLKIMNSSTVAEGIYSLVEAGEYSVYDKCEIYKDTDLDVTGAAEVANNGDSAQWLNCTIGSSANIVADNVIRANMLLTGGIVSGKKCRDNMIDNCVFLTKAGGTEHVDIYGANATDVERLFYVKDSLFYNNILAAADPAHAVGFGAAQTEGNVILKNCTSVNHTVMAQASVNINVDGAVPTFATTGVSVAS